MKPKPKVSNLFCVPQKGGVYNRFVRHTCKVSSAPCAEEQTRRLACQPGEGKNRREKATKRTLPDRNPPERKSSQQRGAAVGILGRMILKTEITQPVREQMFRGVGQIRNRPSQGQCWYCTISECQDQWQHTGLQNCVS